MRHDFSFTGVREEEKYCVVKSLLHEFDFRTAESHKQFCFFSSFPLLLLSRRKKSVKEINKKRMFSTGERTVFRIFYRQKLLPFRH